MVDWLYSRVEGFKDRRDARKYASSLLKHGYLRHTVNKITFSEQCYYTFGDLCQSTSTFLSSVVLEIVCTVLHTLIHIYIFRMFVTYNWNRIKPFFWLPDMASLNLNDGSSGGGSEQDTLAPLPPASANPWPAGGQPYPYSGYPNPPPGFPPGYSEPCHSFHSGSAGSQQSEGRSLCVS